MPLNRANSTVKPSIRVPLTKETVTLAIRAKEAILSPSRKAPMGLDARILEIKGLLKATKINVGKKMPIVAIMASVGPAKMYPMKVAVVKTGPEVSGPPLPHPEAAVGSATPIDRPDPLAEKPTTHNHCQTIPNPLSEKKKKSGHKPNEAVGFKLLAAGYHEIHGTDVNKARSFYPCSASLP